MILLLTAAITIAIAVVVLSAQHGVWPFSSRVTRERANKAGPAVLPDRQRFEKYKAIEAYEVRPGILMMPRYAADGQVCQIGLQRLNYSPEEIRLGSDMLSYEIDPTLEELVPNSERGPGPTGDVAPGTGATVGMMSIRDEEYQNVSIHIYGAFYTGNIPVSERVVFGDNIVATLTWKNRKCQ